MFIKSIIMMLFMTLNVIATTPKDLRVGLLSTREKVKVGSSNYIAIQIINNTDAIIYMDETEFNTSMVFEYRDGTVESTPIKSRPLWGGTTTEADLARHLNDHTLGIPAHSTFIHLVKTPVIKLDGVVRLGFFVFITASSGDLKSWQKVDLEGKGELIAEK